MAYCICSPSRALHLRNDNYVLGSKGYSVERWRSEAAKRGWENRRRWAETRRQREAIIAEAARAEEAAARERMVIAGTVPASTVVAGPVAIEIEGD